MKIEYEDGYLLALLKSVKTIAVVGASQNPEKDSYKVMKFLIDSGYDVLPVNPNVDNLILGKKCFKNLNEIDKQIDMVDVFRSSEFAFRVAEEAINTNAKILWMQLGVINEKAAYLAEQAGLKVIMDRCPKIVLEMT